MVPNCSDSDCSDNSTPKSSVKIRPLSAISPDERKRISRLEGRRASEPIELPQQTEARFNNDVIVCLWLMNPARIMSTENLQNDHSGSQSRLESATSTETGWSNLNSDELRRLRCRHTFCRFRNLRKSSNYTKDIKFVNEYAYFEQKWQDYTKTYELVNPGVQHKIVPHKYTNDPPVAWEMLKSKRTIRNVRQMKPDCPIKIDHVRFVCIGCMHGMQLDPTLLPAGDVLIVAGDFTSCGLPSEIKAFNDLLGQLSHSFKVVIAGDHDCAFDENFLKCSNSIINVQKDQTLKRGLNAALTAAKITDVKRLLTNAIYLQDSMVELFGLQIYGSPWQPSFPNLAFYLQRGKALLDKWNQIPAGIDVLITHTPPLGYGDFGNGYERFGCVELLNSVIKRIRPKYHVSAHIHNGYGCTSDGYTKFINCCLTNWNLELKNSPVIFDIPVKSDTKSQFLNNSKKLMERLSKK